MPNPKLTEDIIVKLATAVAVGTNPEAAARMLGVGRSTFFTWSARGRRPGIGDHLYVKLVEEIDRARGYYETAVAAAGRKHIEKDARAWIYANEELKRSRESLRREAGERAVTGPRIEIVITTEEANGDRPVDAPADGTGDLPRPEGERDSAAPGVVDGGLGRDPGGGAVVIDIQGRAIA